MELDPEEIKLLFTVGVIFLSWVKYYWDKLQEREDEFYPDGLNKCPPDTYPLKDGERVTCISCPRCPEGMEPTPPCGTTLAVKLTGECVPCRAGMFSKKVSSTACTACTDCGSRETLIPCTAERDSVCKECPWLHFEDQESNTCRHCDFCCGRSSSAHIECITSKTCKVNCLHTASTKRKFAQSILRRRVAKASNLRNTSSSLLSKVPRKDRQERSIRNENAVEKENETLFLLELLDRPEYVQFENGRHYEDKTNSLSNQDLDDREIDDLQMLHLRDFDNSVRQENSHRPITEQKDKNTFARSIPGAISVSSTQKEEDLSLSTTLRPIMPMPTARDQTLRGTSPPTQVTNRILLVPTPSFHQQKPKLINVPSLFSSFIGTLAAVAVVGLLVLIAYIVYKKCSHKIRGEYKRLGSKNSLGAEDIVDDDIDKGKEESSRNKTIEDMSDTAKVVEDLNLCDIPPDLEDILVEGLEEQHGRGQNKMYGWQKVGKEAGIPRRELNFYETAYRRPDSFPTKLLLEKLGTQGKTISYLLDVLQRPMVRLDSVASSIRHRVTRI